MKSRAVLGIKALAIIGVAFHHIRNRRFDPATLEAIAILPSLFSWSLLTFIGVSGWLHAISEEKSPRGFLSFTKQRAVRLLLPYSALVFAYALAWHVIQAAGLSNIGIKQNPSFLGKIYHTIPLLEYEPVAEQLYFLPLLFSISIFVHAAVKCHSSFGPALAGSISLLLGMVLTPNSRNTGFNLGILFFGTCSYAFGFLLYLNRHNPWRYALVSGISITLAFALGTNGFAKFIPLVLMCFIPIFDKVSIPVFNWIGEASGTIFAYHTPFILQPLILLSAALPSNLHVAGAIMAALLAVAMCGAMHHGLKFTPARIILM